MAIVREHPKLISLNSGVGVGATPTKVFFPPQNRPTVNRALQNPPRQLEWSFSFTVLETELPVYLVPFTSHKGTYGRFALSSASVLHGVGLVDRTDFKPRAVGVSAPKSSGKKRKKPSLAAAAAVGALFRSNNRRDSQVKKFGSVSQGGEDGEEQEEGMNSTASRYIHKSVGLHCYLLFPIDSAGPNMTTDLGCLCGLDTRLLPMLGRLRQSAGRKCLSDYAPRTPRMEHVKRSRPRILHELGSRRTASLQDQVQVDRASKGCGCSNRTQRQRPVQPVSHTSVECASQSRDNYGPARISGIPFHPTLLFQVFHILPISE